MRPVDIVFYHFPCFDGFTAAWVVRRYAQEVLGQLPEFVPSNYGDFVETRCESGVEYPVWTGPDVRDKHVVIVDFSFPRPILEHLRAKAASVVVLDHHKTAEEQLRGLTYAHFDMERSGAGMTWDYFFEGEYRPALVDLVEDRDLWRFRFAESKAFHAGMLLRPFDFGEWDWATDNVGNVIGEGKVVMRFHRQVCEDLAESAALVDFAGLKIWAVNTPPQFASELGHMLCERPGGQGVAVVWRRNHAKREFTFSFRSAENSGVDVTEVAKLLGGGGHKHAAGARIAGDPREASDAAKDLLRQLGVHGL